MKAKQRVPALRGGQPGDLASNRGSGDRISLRRASMRRKITLNNPGIWGMSAKAACLMFFWAAEPFARAFPRDGLEDRIKVQLQAFYTLPQNDPVDLSVVEVP
jgi:hypothetical protein